MRCTGKVPALSLVSSSNVKNYYMAVHNKNDQFLLSLGSLQWHEALSVGNSKICHAMEKCGILKWKISFEECQFHHFQVFFCLLFWFFHSLCLYQLATVSPRRELTCYPIMFQNNLLPRSAYSLRLLPLPSLSHKNSEWTWNCKISF